MDKFEITCARSNCYVTFSGDNRDAVMVAFRGHDKEAHNFMTGEEFYNKFIKIFLETDKGYHGGFVDMDLVNEIAAKAAGMDEDKT